MNDDCIKKFIEDPEIIAMFKRIGDKLFGINGINCHEEAEPKVLSAGEVHNKCVEDFGFIGNWTTKKHIESVIRSDKNGQLREYYRPEQVELREAVKILLETIPTGFRIQQAIENLKPPMMD